ncbi:GNAT superfamily N-acetyltransferase [Arthrobacter sp. PvP102]|uniref:GNAT family N-acetyltransferase n=1 Tax=unclassified Arthrobacter TaxID=235627 RepID=UPI001B7B9E42|nr:GNAT superfamily N-acetyltransferase [Arthrobacter sp. PvP103]MBP1238518.1 GNAT superfamily N-acetyltransferase [Arthrobacter sp. PvP102]
MTSERFNQPALPDQPALLTLDVDGGILRLRRATRADLPLILELLADDRLGASREDTSDMAPYQRAFEAIDADPCHLLVVGELLVQGKPAGPVVATFQLSFIPGLSRRGSWRSQIEAVRVSAQLRGLGIGAAMVTWAADESRRRGCSLMQLTTHKSRRDAHRFYERLGFAASHEGMKLTL